MKTLKLLSLILFFPVLLQAGIKPMAANVKAANYPEWARNAVIYEVNVRQHTPEGTFKGVENDLPRLKKLGVDILWLMPVNPIGMEKRKGKLGSYYSVRDYQKVNPEFGKEEDLKSLVASAHKLGMKVIIDWVANHSAWDNVWMKDHPDWFQKDSTGKFVSPFDWTDVVNLNYKNKDLRKAMIEAMRYWLKSCDIDGFRCDVAGLVPVDFWVEARLSLARTKHLFMLAEDEDKPNLCDQAFDMNYAWRMHHLMTRIAKGESGADTLMNYQLVYMKSFPERAIKMNFVTNHDENSWNGTVSEKFGEGSKAFALLTYVFPGMPLLYSGQEAGLNKRLRFFEKDTINWSNKELFPFYQMLNKLKHNSKALWNPPFGGSFIPLITDDPSHVLSFIRQKDKEKVVVLINLSPKPVYVEAKTKAIQGKYKEIFSNREETLGEVTKLRLTAWGYKVYTLSED
ncbi:MAG: alpha-amylase family glycosyl hydrolase [Bacteroidetes bacterium]|nr:alpha-amylase family glycosyl hydrolase [Bacteroidota bacterium]